MSSGRTHHYYGQETITENKLLDNVSISGMCKIPHDFECNELRVSGSVEASGNLIAHGEVRNSGMFQISGDVTCDASMRCAGLMRVGGSASIQNDLRTAGVLNVDGGIIVNHDARLAGSVKTQSNMFVRGELHANGVLKVRGSLVVDGSDAKVTCAGIPSFLGNWGRSQVGFDIIAQQEITLRHINVEGNVYGANVRIEKGVNVGGAVYYAESIDVSEKANLVVVPVKITLQQLQQVRVMAANTNVTNATPHSTSQGNQPQLPLEGLTPQESSEVAVATGEVPAPTRLIAYCPQCGSHLKNPSRFCPYCGLKIAD
jgi:cytoskeletal protein CcmA (bactofilin family)